MVLHNWELSFIKCVGREIQTICLISTVKVLKSIVFTSEMNITGTLPPLLLMAKP